MTDNPIATESGDPVPAVGGALKLTSAGSDCTPGIVPTAHDSTNWSAKIVVCAMVFRAAGAVQPMTPSDVLICSKSSAGAPTVGYGPPECGAKYTAPGAAATNEAGPNVAEIVAGVPAVTEDDCAAGKFAYTVLVCTSGLAAPSVDGFDVASTYNAALVTVIVDTPAVLKLVASDAGIVIDTEGVTTAVPELVVAETLIVTVVGNDQAPWLVQQDRLN